MSCHCVNVDIGSYDNQVELPRPECMKGRAEGSTSEIICVDTCIAREVQGLWKLGIRTTGCCCGHGRQLAYIGVIHDDIPRMHELGYEVAAFPGTDVKPDTFKPKYV